MPNSYESEKRASHAKETPKRKGSLLWRVVFWIAVAVCVVSLAALAAIVYSYWAADHRYESLAETAFSASSEEGGAVASSSLAELNPDWEYLRSINPDVIAWIYVPGTAINYPVCYRAGDSQYYLDTDFNGNNDWTTRSGTIFLDGTNSPSLTDECNFFYGHHMNDGSMFAALSLQLSSNEEFNAHRTVYLLTPAANYRLQSFALILTTGTDLVVEANFGSAELRTAYIQDKMDRSIVTPAEGMPDAASIDQVFALSTCDYTQNNGRAIMYCQLMEKVVPHGADAGSSVSGDDAQAVTEGSLEAA